MNNQPPLASPTGSPPPAPNTPIDLQALARAQKWVPLGNLVNIAIIVLDLALQSLGTAPGAVPETPNLMTLFLLFLRLLLTLGAGWVGYNLATALKFKVAWLVALLTFFSLLGFVVLLSLNKYAKVKLRTGGYRLGLLGAKKP